MGDGDGWVRCARGHRHWGRYGAAGLLIRTPEAVVLQHRAPWSHHGDTWGLPGGARDSRETAPAAALREAAEEAGVQPGEVLPAGVVVDDHGGWSYATVLAEPVGVLQPAATSAESVQVRWVPLQDVAGLPLHPGFAAGWPTLRSLPPAPVLVVDAANVVGSRPDGWWHDRLAAAQRLHDRLADFARSGLAPESWPQSSWRVGPSPAPGPESWPPSSRGGGLSWLYPRVTMVVEGQARTVTADTAVRVVRADGSGDDAIVGVVRDQPHPVVVTADRELRERVGALGACVVGPRWLWTALGSAAAPGA